MGSYIVVDLEMCRVPKGERREAFGHYTELIQIGAVRLNDELEICDTFETFVRPEYGTVDAFIHNLTGISPEDVSAAPCAEQALKLFLEWLPEDAILISWSENDLDQIYAELDGKSIELPELQHFLDDWIDCQEIFSEKMQSDRNYKLSEALNITEIIYDEGEHNALVDAINTAKLFAKMEKEPDLKLSSSIVTESTGSYTPFADLLSGFKA